MDLHFSNDDNYTRPTKTQDCVRLNYFIPSQLTENISQRFKNSRSIAPLYTSGPVTLTADGIRIVTCVAEEVLLTNVLTGVEICRFAGVSA